MRSWLIRWMYGVAAVHLLVGLALPWMADTVWLAAYHRTVAQGVGAPEGAQVLSAWWMALFGPTVQSLSLWMGALVWLGARQRSPAIWGALLAGLLLWAPQDIWLSLRAGVVLHLWIDLAALTTMLPPLFLLYRLDRQP